MKLVSAILWVFNKNIVPFNTLFKIIVGLVELESPNNLHKHSYISYWPNMYSTLCHLLRDSIYPNYFLRIE